MNLKKIFIGEFIGAMTILILIGFLILYVSDSKIPFIASLILSPILAVYIFRIHRNREGVEEENLILLKKAWKAAGLICTAAMLIYIFLWFPDYSLTGKGISHYFIYGWSALFLFSHSIIGFIQLKKSNGEPVHNLFNGIMDKLLKLPDGYIMIRYSFFFGVVFLGFTVLFLNFLFNSRGNFSNGIFLSCYMILYVPGHYIYSTRKMKQRRLDEREKNMIFKITSLTSVISLFLFVILFALKDTVVHGYAISNIWGIILLPIFLTIWGISGFLILLKEEGGFNSIFAND